MAVSHGVSNPLPRHPYTSWECIWTPKTIPWTPLQKVFGCLGFTKTFLGCLGMWYTYSRYCLTFAVSDLRSSKGSIFLYEKQVGNPPQKNTHLISTHIRKTFLIYRQHKRNHLLEKTYFYKQTPRLPNLQKNLRQKFWFQWVVVEIGSLRILIIIAGLFLSP